MGGSKFALCDITGSRTTLIFLHQFYPAVEFCDRQKSVIVATPKILHTCPTTRILYISLSKRRQSSKQVHPVSSGMFRFFMHTQEYLHVQRYCICIALITLNHQVSIVWAVLSVLCCAALFGLTHFNLSKFVYLVSARYLKGDETMLTYSNANFFESISWRTARSFSHNHLNDSYFNINQGAMGNKKN